MRSSLDQMRWVPRACKRLCLEWQADTRLCPFTHATEFSACRRVPIVARATAIQFHLVPMSDRRRFRFPMRRRHAHRSHAPYQARRPVQDSDKPSNEIFALYMRILKRQRLCRTGGKSFSCSQGDAGAQEKAKRRAIPCMGAFLSQQPSYIPGPCRSGSFVAVPTRLRRLCAYLCTRCQ